MTDAKKNSVPPKNRRAEKGKILAFDNGNLYKLLPKFRTNLVEVLDRSVAWISFSFLFVFRFSNLLNSLSSFLCHSINVFFST